MTITFLPLTAAGIPRVLRYMAQLYESGGYDEERQRRALEHLLDAPELGGTWLIQADRQPAGYLVLTVCYSLEFHGPYALVDELFVEDIWRDQKIGTQTLAFAEEWARRRGFRTLRLEVGHSNPGALRLYRRSGFDAPDRHLLSKAL